MYKTGHQNMANRATNSADHADPNMRARREHLNLRKHMFPTSDTEEIIDHDNNTNIQRIRDRVSRTSNRSVMAITTIALFLLGYSKSE